MSNRVRLYQHLGSIKNSQPDDFIVAQSDDYSFISDVAIIRGLRLFKVDIQNIAFFIIVKFGSFCEIYFCHFTLTIFSCQTFEVKRTDLFVFDVVSHSISAINPNYIRLKNMCQGKRNVILFNASISLKPGKNIIEALAIYGRGQKLRDEIVVYY